MNRTLQPWHWRSLPLNHRSGSDIFTALFRPQPNAAPHHQIATLLESPVLAEHQPRLAHSRYSICAGAPRTYQGQPQLWTPGIGEILPCLSSRLQSAASLPHDLPPLPFTGGWLGWVGYDLAWEIEQLPHLKADPLPFPVAYWYEPDTFAVLDHWEQTLWLAATHPQQLDQLEHHLHHTDRVSASPQATAETSRKNSLLEKFSSGSALSSAPHFQTNQADYEAAVVRAKQYIQAGDIFQANLSLRFETHTSADSWTIYRTLQKINPSPFASYWQTPWGAVVSCSPERLVQLRGQQADTRPIAGTRSRGNTPDQDQHQAQDLLANAKENAEHIMLVDLERNDLGRVCEWGSVVVDELMVIERYSHVMHLVSNVKGILRSEQSAIDLIRALFPGGTITGCPKVRCMEIIEELEPVRRSLFYGSCGYLDWRGNLDLNILIRTLLITPDPAEDHGSRPAGAIARVWGQVGAGIVADSDPTREWYESLQKAQAQLIALHLVEQLNG